MLAGGRQKVVLLFSVVIVFGLSLVVWMVYMFVGGCLAAGKDD